MILEEETYKQFGYYPSDYAQGSHKKIVAKCDECDKVRAVDKRDYNPLCRSCNVRGERGPFYGCHHTDAAREVMSKTHKGKKLSEEVRKKMSDAHKGEKNYFYGCHHTDATRKKLSIAHKGKKLNLSDEQRRKLSERQKGKVGPNLGKKASEETRRKMSIAHSNPSPEVRRKLGEANRGRRFSEEHKRKISEALKGKIVSDETKEKIREARKRQRFPKHNVSTELIFKKISEDNNIPSQHTGDGAIWIGKKSEGYLNPDFIIKVNGKKYAVEIDGDYWHSPLLNHGLNEKRTVTYREKHYKKHGWIPIFIWETDLKRRDAEQFVLNLLKKEGVIK